MEPISKSPWAEVGRGAVVAAPKHHPAWLANAALNNPTATATGAVATAGAASQAPRFEHKRSAKKERAADVAAAASVGAGAGLAADRGAFYALKREYKKKKYTAGQNGRSAKRELKELKEAAAAKHPGNPRKQEHYKNANWPERFADSKLRRVAAKHTGGKTAAALAVGGAALGAGIALKHNKKEIKKMIDHTDSPFLISKADKKKKPGPTAGRLATGYLAGPFHGLVAGKGAGGKAKSAALQTAAPLAGAVAGAALTRNPLGGTAGGLAGNLGATTVAHHRGWLKPQKKGAL